MPRCYARAAFMTTLDSLARTGRSLPPQRVRRDEPRRTRAGATPRPFALRWFHAKWIVLGRVALVVYLVLVPLGFTRSSARRPAELVIPLDHLTGFP